MNPSPTESRFERVFIASGEQVGLRADGYGPQLRPLIEEARRRFRRRLELAELQGTTPERLIATAPDLVAWQDGRAVALLVATDENGGDLAVTWLHPERPLLFYAPTPEPTAGGGL